MSFVTKRILSPVFILSKMHLNTPAESWKSVHCFGEICLKNATICFHFKQKKISTPPAGYFVPVCSQLGRNARNSAINAKKLGYNAPKPSTQCHNWGYIQLLEDQHVPPIHGPSLIRYGQSPLICRTTVHRTEADPYNGLRIKQWCSWPDLHCVCRWHDWCYPRGFPTKLRRWRVKWQNGNEAPTDIQGTLNETNAMLYPGVFSVLNVFACMPISTATAERSFSTMKRVKTYLRNTMTTQRLSGLGLLNIYSEKEIKADQVMDIFSRKKETQLGTDLQWRLINLLNHCP